MFTMQEESLRKFSGRLRNAMTLSGLNAAALSEKSGVSKGYISGFLSEKKPRPSEKILSKLSRVLECSPLWLAGSGENFVNYEEAMEQRKLLAEQNTSPASTTDGDAKQAWVLFVAEYGKGLDSSSLLDLMETLVKVQPPGYEKLFSGFKALLKKKLADQSEN